MKKNRLLLLGTLTASGALLSCGDDKATIVEPPPVAAVAKGSITVRPVLGGAQGSPTYSSDASGSGDSTAPEIRSLVAVKTAARPDSSSSVSLVRLPVPDDGVWPSTSDSSLDSMRLSSQGSTASDPKSQRAPKSAPTFDSAHVRLLGATTKIVALPMANPSITIDALRPGEYTVLFEGFIGGEVDHFGVTQARVIADRDTAVVVAYQTFRPVIFELPTPTTFTTLPIVFDTVSSALAYLIEIDIDSTFSNPDTITVSPGGAWAAIWEPMTVYFRARAKNRWIELGRASDGIEVKITTDMDPSGDAAISAPFLGFGADANETLWDLNILPDGDMDWFTLGACGFDTLLIEVHANDVFPPSLLDSFLEVHDSSGWNAIAVNDNYGEYRDSRLSVVLPESGRYYIKMRGKTVEDVGHYVLLVDVTEGPLNSGTDCYAPVPTSLTVTPSTAELTVGYSRDLVAQVHDQVGRVMTEVSDFGWSNSNESVVHLDSSGRAVGMGVGSATVVVTAGTLTGQAELSVIAGPETSDPLAFTADWGGDRDIYIRNADGSGILNLTRNPADDWQSSWSPDGSRILFVSDRNGNEEIYVMNADGSGILNLTNNGAADSWPAWSRDGSRIAFVSDRGGNDDIYLMDAVGTIVNQVTADAGQEAYLSWAPDGSRLVFHSDQDGDMDVYGIEVDGSNLVNISNNGFAASEPEMSPDGNRIAYRSGVSYSTINAMDEDGSSVVPLTGYNTTDMEPSWAIDGGLLVYGRDREGWTDLWVMESDASAFTRITGTDGHASLAKFKPSGLLIAAVEITPTAPDTIRSLGGTLQLTAQAIDYQGNVVSPVAHTWISSDSAVVTVDGTGRVTGTGYGSAYVSATEPLGRSDSVLVTVHDHTVAGVPAFLAYLAGDNQVGLAGSPLADSLWVSVTDVYGEGAAGAEVVWTIIGGDGSVAPVTSTTNAQGHAKTEWVLGTQSGILNTLEASVIGLDGVAILLTATAKATMDFSVSDLVYDSSRDRIYAVVPWWGYGATNGVVSIDPNNLHMEMSVELVEPEYLALSDDKQFLYVSEQEGRAIRKIDLATFTADTNFNVQVPQFADDQRVLDLEVLPGDPNAVAVSTRNINSTPWNGGVIVFDNGVPRDSVWASHRTFQWLDFGSAPDTLYANDPWVETPLIRKYAISSVGIHLVSEFPGFSDDTEGDLKVAGGRIFTTSGKVIDAVDGTVIATIPVSGSVLPDPERNRVYTVSRTSPPTIAAYDWDTFETIGEASPAGVSGSAWGNLIRWGTSGLAFTTESQIVIWETDLVTR